MITIILPISRSDYLRPVFKCLADLERPEDTELLILIDGNSELERAVDKRLESIKYRHIQVIKYGDVPGEDINSRRFRIAAIHNMAGHYIMPDCDQVFLIEDDTVYPADALTKLARGYSDKPNCAFIQAVQVGRHNTPYIGSWKADDINEPTAITSMLPSDGIEPIDAGGLYCGLVDAWLYQMHHFEPYDKEGTNGLSCDVNFGLFMRQVGYDCFIDWSIRTDHISPDKGSVNLGNTKPVRVTFEKLKDKWRGRTLVDSPAEARTRP